MKKKRIWSLVLVAVMMTTLISGNYVFAETDESNNDIEIPSYITKTVIEGVEYLEFDSGEDMAWLREHIMNKEDGGTTGAYYCTHNIILTDDIDMTNYNTYNGENNGEWSGIGWGQQWIGYSGIFDGAGHTIFNIDVYTDQPVGPKGLLFNITKNATIKNIAVQGKVSSNRYIGGLVGRTTGSIKLENVVVDAELSLSQGNANAIGGLIGQVGSGQTTGGEDIVIDNCAAVGTYGSSTSSNPVGGLIGHVYGGYNVSIDNSYAAADLRCDGGNVAGLIAGQGTSTLKINNTYYLDTMADTSLIVMTANGDSFPVGPTSNFVEVTPVSSDEMKSDQFLNNLKNNFKSDGHPPIANGYPIPNAIISQNLEFSEFSWSGSPETDYMLGETFNVGTLVVNANYSGNTKRVANVAISKTDPLTLDDNETFVTVTASYDGRTESREYPITVRNLQKLEVTTLPNQTKYVEGQTFSRDGMVVTATFEKLGSVVVTDYSYSPSDPLTPDDKEIVISYKGKTATVEIDVEANALDHLSIWTKPDNLIYAQGETIDPSGALVYAAYTNTLSSQLQPATEESPDGYTWSEDNSVVTISYTYRGVTKTAEYNITRLNSNAPELEQGVYQLENADDLVWFSNQVGMCGNGDINGKLLADVDLSDEYYLNLFYPIGQNKKPYSGSFDGNKHTVTLGCSKNIMSVSGSVGLFGTAKSASIKNVIVDGFINLGSSSDSRIAGIVGKMTGGSVVNCINKANITANDNLGGIVGESENVVIKNCVNLGDITTADPDNGTRRRKGAGGIVGRASGDGIVENCYNTGDIVCNYGGGIAGMSEVNIRNCYNTGTVTSIVASDNRYLDTFGIGGIAGLTQNGCNSIENVYSVGQLVTEYVRAGSIVGYVGSELLETGAASLNLNNAYFVAADDSVDIFNVNEANGSSVIVSNTEAKDAAWLKSIDAVTALGSAFRMDSESESLNDGYPVLSWQVGSYVIVSDGIENGTVEVSASVVHPGETVEISLTPAAGYTVGSVSVKDSEGNDVSVTNNTFIMPESDVIVSAEFKKQTSGGSGGGGSAVDTTERAVTAAESADGTVSVSPEKAKSGSTVTVAVTPDEGYKLDKLVVTDADGKTITVTAKDGKYTFTMPASEVSVKASFVKDDAQAQPGDGKEMTFTDVSENDWFYDDVAYVFDRGMMNGTSETLFSPSVDTTRAMIVTILYRLEGSPAAGGADFSDVASGAYYDSAVAWAAANDIVKGYEDGTFKPDKAITRQEMAAILYRYAAFKKYDTAAAAELDKFSDADQISSYAVPAMKWANAEGLINGVGNDLIDAEGSAVRSQSAAILARFCKNIAEI